jgi:hypothetical protein
VRIRHYGYLASRRRGELVPLSQQLLAAAPVSTPARIPTSPEPLSLWTCPICGGPMVLIERLTARQIALRSPPLTKAACYVHAPSSPDSAPRTKATTCPSLALLSPHPSTPLLSRF